MKIQSISTVPVDPVRMQSSGVGSVASSQASTNRDREVAQPRKALQNETRSAEEIQRDIEAINKQLTFMNQSLQFSIDKESQDVVIKIVDKDSGKVIKQIPPEEVIRLRERLMEMSGLLVEKTV